jgi:hypothetical protein
MADNFIKLSKVKNTLSHIAQNHDYAYVKKQWEANKAPNKKPYEEVIFCSTDYETTIKYENTKTGDEEQIMFKRGAYLTNNKSQIDFLRNTDLFDVVIYENKLPESIVREQEYERRYLTSHDKEYE